jgi:hypothetical protein
MSELEVIKKKSLGILLDELRNIDPDLPPDQFDPEKLVGEIKGKVDAIKWRRDSWKAEAELVQLWIKKLQARKASLLGKRDRLSAYVKAKMMFDKFTKLPGDLCRVQLVKKSRVKFTTEPTAQIYLDYPDLVQQKVHYAWKDGITDKVRELIKTGFQHAIIEEAHDLTFFNTGDTDEQQFSGDSGSTRQIEAGDSEGAAEQSNA